MSDFPILKTGAVMQYPAQRLTEFVTQVLRFVDGSEQRFAGYSAPMRTWVIRLDLLDEEEINQLTSFFTLQKGAAGTFSFTDPWDSSVYPNCSFAGDGMVTAFRGENLLRTVLTIRRNAD